MSNLLWFLALITLAMLMVGALFEWTGGRVVGHLPLKPSLPNHHHEGEPSREPPST